VPRTEANLWNVTLVGTPNNQAALFREGMLGVMGNFLFTNYGAPPDISANTEDPAGVWPDRLVIRDSVFHEIGTFPQEDLDRMEVCTEAQDSWPGPGAWSDPNCASLSPDEDAHLNMVEATRLDDDFGFDEPGELMDPALNNTFDVDPMITLPSFVPGNAALSAGGTPVFNANAPAGFGDASATFVGALDPAGEDWTAGWTAYPDN